MKKINERQLRKFLSKIKISIKIHNVSASSSYLNCKLLLISGWLQHSIFICPELSTFNIREHINNTQQLIIKSAAGTIKNIKNIHRVWCKLNRATTKFELYGE